MPIVSVVIPAYNAQRTIADALRSVLCGAFRDFEIIVCDDGSVDGTADEVLSIHDNRVRLIRNHINRGEGAARDCAIAAATGRWIAPLDADDMFTPDRLMTLVDVATCHSDAVVFDEVMICHDTPQGVHTWRPVRRPGLYPGVLSQVRLVRFVDWIRQKRIVMQPLIPTRLIREFDVEHTTSRAGADVGFRCRLLGRSGAELWYVPSAMYLYRTTPGGTSTTAGRHELLATEIESAIPAFASNDEAVQALRARAKDARKAAKYQAFFSHLMHNEFASASKDALREPWVIREFVSRGIRQIPYHLSRWRYHGSWRKTT